MKVLCGQLAIFELRSARLVLQLPCHEKAVRGPTLARHMGRTSGEHAGDMQGTCRGHGDVIVVIVQGCFDRHPFTEMLVTGSFDKTVKFWS